MYVQLSISEIKSLENKKLAKQISRWETITKARSYYSKMKGIHTAYKADKNELNSAFATPVKVFLITEVQTK